MLTLSASRIKIYRTCPKQYWYHYLTKRPKPTMPWWVDAGAAFHEGIAAALRLGTSDAKLLLPEMSLKFHTAPWLQETLEDITFYYHKISKLFQVAQIERTLTVPLSEDLSLMGIIDLITQERALVDHKTTKWQWADDRAIKELQPYIYTLVAQKAGLSPTGFYFSVLSKEPVCKVSMFRMDLGQADLDQQEASYIATGRAILSGKFDPTPSAAACRYCDYAGECLIK